MNCEVCNDPEGQFDCEDCLEMHHFCWTDFLRHIIAHQASHPLTIGNLKAVVKGSRQN